MTPGLAPQPYLYVRPSGIAADVAVRIAVIKKESAMVFILKEP